MSKPPTAFADLEEFDAAGTLAAAEQAVRDRRAGEHARFSSGCAGPTCTPRCPTSRSALCVAG